uniref:ABC transporter family protein n=1 Tax=Rhizophora mucronata TaxID=61149 RepID=A0A2P2JSN7_RHIMU
MLTNHCVKPLRKSVYIFGSISKFSCCSNLLISHILFPIC